MYKNKLMRMCVCDANLTKVEAYMTVLLKMCIENNQGKDNDVGVISAELAERRFRNGINGQIENSRESYSDEHIIIISEMNMIFRLDISMELSTIGVKVIGPHPTISSRPIYYDPYLHCLNPCGLFCCERTVYKSAKIKCILVDIHTLNYIQLPDIDVPKGERPKCALYVNTRLYLICRSSEQPLLTYMKYLCLRKPVHWKSCPPIRGAGSFSDARVIGTKIYMSRSNRNKNDNKLSIHMNCYDTSSSSWNMSSQPPEMFSGDSFRIVGADQDILMHGYQDDIEVGVKDSAWAKYSTVKDHWTILVPPKLAINIAVTDTTFYLAKNLLGVHKKDSRTLNIYKVPGNSFTHSSLVRLDFPYTFEDCGFFVCNIW